MSDMGIDNTNFDDRAVNRRSVTWSGRGPTRIEWSDELIAETISKRVRTDAVHRGLTRLKSDLVPTIDDLPTSLPRTLSGLLLLPDGRPGAALSVEVDRPEWTEEEDEAPWDTPITVSNPDGLFSLELPDAPIPDNGLTLTIRGGDTFTTLTPRRADLVRGDLGTVTLDRPLAPLGPDALEALGQDPETVDGTQDDFQLGEDECARQFRSNAGVIDRYRWSNLIRLVEPQVHPKQGQIETEAGAIKAPSVGTMEDLIYGQNRQRGGDRVPIGEPIDIDAFRRGLEAKPEDVPKAGSLALGYIVQMSQAWIPRGLSLGDLLYSLPLAPGEQQKVVVSESDERYTVAEREQAELSELQSQTDTLARSTSQLFGATMDEVGRGGSSFTSNGESSNIGGGFSFLGIGFSAGGSWSNSSGSTNSWQRSSRDFVSWAAEAFHSSLSRRAAISRQTSSTSVRLASLDDRDELASKVVTNYNRTRALTLQYWEVQKNYTVTTDIDDIEMVCFVPLEIVRWLTGQDGDGPDGTLPSNVTRDYLLKRYETVLRHAAVLRRRFRYQPRFRRALEVLEQLAANPFVDVQAGSEERQLVMSVSVTGTFLPFDRLSVQVVTRDGRRIGPATMNLSSVEEPVPREALTRGDVIDELRSRRADIDGAESTRTADVVLPRSVAASDLARFEIRHSFRGWTYRPPDIRAEGAESGDTLNIPLFGRDRPIARTPISFSANELSQTVGAPQVWDIEVLSMSDESPAFASDLVGSNAAQVMPARYVLPVTGQEPVLDADELRLLEEMLGHLREHALRYSQAVWSALTAQERVMLLEPWTLGLADDGPLADIPLLSCVANRVLGYYGNSMVLPFHVPRQLAEETDLTSLQLEEALLQFHRQSFRPPRTEIALSSGGMLGEAVLGACVSAEKIDLTRFWAWGEHPLPLTADDPNQVAFGAERLVSDEGPAAAPRVLGETAAPRFDILPSSLPATDFTLASLLAKIPASQLPSDLTASALAGIVAPRTLTEAAALARTATEKGLAAAAATRVTWDDVLSALQASDALDREIGNLSLSSFGNADLGKLAQDPSGVVDLLAATPEGERDAKATELAGSITGGEPLSASDQASAFASLKSFGEGVAGDAAKGLALKALMTALGLPPIL